MRATLSALGAFLFLAYPLVLLLAVARNIDEPGKQPNTAAITTTSPAASTELKKTKSPSSYRHLRNTTLRKSGL